MLDFLPFPSKMLVFLRVLLPFPSPQIAPSGAAEEDEENPGSGFVQAPSPTSLPRQAEQHMSRFLGNFLLSVSCTEPNLLLVRTLLPWSLDVLNPLGPQVSLKGLPAERGVRFGRLMPKM